MRRPIEPSSLFEDPRTPPHLAISCLAPLLPNARNKVVRLPLMCRFSAAGMTVSPRTPMAGGRKAPRHEIAGWERRWCHTYGDFAAGSGVDVVERGGNVDKFCQAACA